MIFIAGAILCLVGIGLFIMFLMKSKRPKAEGYIQEITLDYYEKDTAKIKKHPHGLIKYVYQSIAYEKKILLMKRKCQVGEKIEISIKGDNPEQIEMYAPKSEIITAIVVFSIGVLIMIACVAILESFNMW